MLGPCLDAGAVFRCQGPVLDVGVVFRCWGCVPLQFFRNNVY